MIKKLVEIKNESGRNLNTLVDEDTLIPGETGSDSNHIFGAFNFFQGINAFFKNLLPNGKLYEETKLAIPDSSGVYYTTLWDLWNFIQDKFQKASLWFTGTYSGENGKKYVQIARFQETDPSLCGEVHITSQEDKYLSKVGKIKVYSNFLKDTAEAYVDDSIFNDVVITRDFGSPTTLTVYGRIKTTEGKYNYIFIPTYASKSDGSILEKGVTLNNVYCMSSVETEVTGSIIPNKRFDENDVMRAMSGKSRLTSLNLAPADSTEYGEKRFCLSTSSAVTGRPNDDGFVDTYFWDNVGRYDTQLFLPNNVGIAGRRLKVRSKGNESDWTDNWKELAFVNDFSSYRRISMDEQDTTKVKDLNVIKTPSDTSIKKFYYADYFNAKAARVSVESLHTPGGNDGYAITFCNTDSNQHVQVAFSGGDTFYRNYNESSGWGSWVRLAKSSEIPTSLPANGGTATKASQDGDGNTISSTYCKKFTTSMTGLGFAKGSNVDVSTFLNKIRETYGSNCIVNFSWSDANGAYITDGTNKTELISGYTLFVGLNTFNTSSTTWCPGGALLVGSSSRNNIYLLNATIAGTAGTVNSKSVKRIADASEIPSIPGVATTSADGLMSSADKTKLNGIATGANNYTHPTTAGNKHIPTGGASNQFLKYSSSGTATWAYVSIPPSRPSSLSNGMMWIE